MLQSFQEPISPSNPPKELSLFSNNGPSYFEAEKHSKHKRKVVVWNTALSFYPYFWKIETQLTIFNSVKITTNRSHLQLKRVFSKSFGLDRHCQLYYPSKLREKRNWFGARTMKCGMQFLWGIRKRDWRLKLRTRKVQERRWIGTTMSPCRNQHNMKHDKQKNQSWKQKHQNPETKTHRPPPTREWLRNGQETSTHAQMQIAMKLPDTNRIIYSESNDVPFLE